MADRLTPGQFRAVEHWSKYGRKGQPSNRRYGGPEGTDRESNSFSSPVTATWDIKIPRAELPKLLNGFEPQQMEDKWLIYADGPDAEGNAAVHMLRSWTGYKVLELKIKVPLDEDGEFREEDSTITEIVWETDRERYINPTEEGVKAEARAVCNWVLDLRLDSNLPQ